MQADWFLREGDTVRGRARRRQATRAGTQKREQKQKNSENKKS